MLDIFFCKFSQIFTKKKKLVEWMLLAFFLIVICCSDYVNELFFFFFFYNFPIVGRTIAVKLFASRRTMVRCVTLQHLLATKFHFLFRFPVQRSFR
jgi:hypothetical protein